MADTEYLPGRVYRATVRGESDVLVYRYAFSDGSGYWISLVPVGEDRSTAHFDARGHIYNIVGPLYILHLTEPRRIIEVLENATHYSAGQQIRDQLPPTRIPEPPKGSFVEASSHHVKERDLFVRHPVDGHWYQVHGTSVCVWSALTDPKVVTP